MVSEERRQVKWMKKEFTDKIEGLKPCWEKMLDALECCKQHDGPATAKDIEKLKSFTESEIIAEAVFSEEDNCT